MAALKRSRRSQLLQSCPYRRLHQYPYPLLILLAIITSHHIISDLFATAYHSTVMLSLQEENPDGGVVQEESIASVALVSDEGQTNERELLLKTLLSEKASEASLKRTFTAAGKERDDAFASLERLSISTQYCIPSISRYSQS